MRHAAALAFSVLLASPLSAQAQFKRYVDVGALRIAALKQPGWGIRVGENRVRYLCLSGCAVPTAIAFKGVVRGERLPEAFESGALAPAALKQQGETSASRLGSTFLGAVPVAVGGQKGVQMEASADLNGAAYFVTRWIGQGDRQLVRQLRAVLPRDGVLVHLAPAPRDEDGSERRAHGQRDPAGTSGAPATLSFHSHAPLPTRTMRAQLSRASRTGRAYHAWTSNCSSP